MNTLRKALVGTAALGALALGFAAPASAAPSGVSLGHAASVAQAPASTASCVYVISTWASHANIRNGCSTSERVQVVWTNGPSYYTGACYTVSANTTQTFVGPAGYNFSYWQHC